MKKLFFLSAVLLFGLASCSKDDSITDKGVVINGVRWATRNVDVPGTFAATPECFGKHFQWNRRRGWSTTDVNVIEEGWDRSIPKGTRWYATNDPCPRGWRVPTESELRSLRDAGHVFILRRGVHGYLFGTPPNQIFLPAAGLRCSFGILSPGHTGGDYWSSTQKDSDLAWGLKLTSIVDMFQLFRPAGLSVRCVTDD